jgi:tetratricopeptide (TPR) repeat protein
MGNASLRLTLYDLEAGDLLGKPLHEIREKLAELRVRLDNAIPELRQNVRHDPKAAALRELLAEVLRGRGRIRAREARVFYQWRDAASDFEDAALEYERLAEGKNGHHRWQRSLAICSIGAAGPWRKAKEVARARAALERADAALSSRDNGNVIRCSLVRSIQLEQAKCHLAEHTPTKARDVFAEWPPDQKDLEYLALAGEIEAEVGEWHDAARHFQTALELWSGEPVDLPIKAAEAFVASGSRVEAENFLREAVKTLSERVSTDPARRRFRLGLAASRHALAVQLGAGDESLGLLRSAMEQLHLVSGLGTTRELVKEADAEVSSLAFAIRESLQDLGEEAPHPKWKRSERWKDQPGAKNEDFLLARKLSNTGQYLILLRRYEDAEPRLDDARSRLQALVDSSLAAPVLWRHELAFAHTRTGRLLRLTKRADEALKFNDAAIEEREAILAEFPNADDIGLELISDLIERAEIYKAQGDLTQAQSAAQRSILRQEEILENQEPPGRGDVLDFMGVANYSLAKIRKLMGDLAGCRQAHLRSKEIRLELYRRAPSKARWAGYFVNSLEEFAAISDRLSHFGVAEVSYIEAADIQRQLTEWAQREANAAPTEKDPQALKKATARLASYGKSYVRILQRQGRHYEWRGEFERALTFYELADKWARQVREIASGDSADDALFKALAGEGGVLVALGRIDEARAILDEAESLSENQASSRALRAAVLRKRGTCLLAQGHFKQAKIALEGALTILDDDDVGRYNRFEKCLTQLALSNLQAETNNVAAGLHKDAASTLTELANSHGTALETDELLSLAARNVLNASENGFFAGSDRNFRPKTAY